MKTRLMRGLLGVVPPVLFVAAALAGCDARPARIESFPLSPESEQRPPDVRASIAKAMEAYFGTPVSPKVPKNEVVTGERLLAGGDHYRRLCLHCHGLAGDGAGPTAAFLQPRPRDYRLGTFKFTSTAPDVKKPTRSDLMKTLKGGIMYTSMPAFGLLDDETLESLVDYVVFLSMRGQFEKFLNVDYEEDPELFDIDSMAESDKDLVVSRWDETTESVVAPTVKPPEDVGASIARGKDLYLDKKLQCLSCHGETGRGDGAGTDLLKDDWGFKIVPADLTKGIYRGGSRPKDLWLRIYSGVKGTPMPAFNGALTPEQIWDVVNYVRSLAEPSTN